MLIVFCIISDIMQCLATFSIVFPIFFVCVTLCAKSVFLIGVSPSGWLVWLIGVFAAKQSRFASEVDLLWRQPDATPHKALITYNILLHLCWVSVEE